MPINCGSAFREQLYCTLVNDDTQGTHEGPWSLGEEGATRVEHEDVGLHFHTDTSYARRELC